MKQNEKNPIYVFCHSNIVEGKIYLHFSQQSRERDEFEGTVVNQRKKKKKKKILSFLPSSLSPPFYVLFESFFSVHCAYINMQTYWMKLKKWEFEEYLKGRLLMTKNV